MAYDRYEQRQGGREPRARGDERYAERGYGRGFDRDRPSYDRDERGWLERAGDEISSWFGDDDYGRRRIDERGEREAGRRSAMGGEDRFERSARYRDEGYRRPYTGSQSGRQGFGGPDRGERPTSHRPFTSDMDRGRNEFTGMASGVHDPHYSEWRQRQIDSLDRDYDEYRRENQSRFEDEFSNWRGQRLTKRQMLDQLREHMEVVGSDEEHVGKVDRVAGDRIILAKNDSDANGSHHSLSCSALDRIEGDKVFLNCKAEEAKRRWRDDRTGRALFEREDQGEAGPMMLNRSFSGTY